MQIETHSQVPPQNSPPPISAEQGSEITPLNVIRTETILSKLPIHNLAKKGRVDIQIVKLGPKGEIELKWEVSYNERYGQARQLAYKLDTIVVDHHIDESGRPLPERICLGSLNEIAQELGIMADHGTTHKNLKKAFRQNALAGITAKFKYKTNDGTERTLEATFTRYSVIFTGEKLSDGRKADAVYIELNHVYREVLNNAPTRPLNLDYKKQLAPAPQRFYEIVSYKIYSALKNNLPTANLLYSEYCTFSAQQRYFDYDHFKKQMYKIHRPHLQSGYIIKVNYDQTTDEQGRLDWVMRYLAGPKARAEYATFTGKKVRAIDAAAVNLGAGESGQHHYRRPRQKPLPLRPVAEPATPALAPVIIDYQVVAELNALGITEADARTNLATLPPDYPIRDVIDYAHSEITRPGSGIRNPAGFVITLLQQRSLPPATFETSQARKTRHEAELKRQQAFTEAQSAAEAQQELERHKTDQLFNSLSPEQQADLERQVKAELKAKHPKVNWDAESAVHEGTIRAGIRRLLQDRPVAVSQLAPSATMPPESEQEIAEQQPFTPLTQAQLLFILTTLQLSPPKPKS